MAETEIKKRSLADLSHSEAKNWNEIIRFGVMGFFMGSVLWVAGLGFHQLFLLLINILNSAISSFAYALPDWMVTEEAALSFGTWLNDVELFWAGIANGIVNIWDISGLTVPILVAMALFYWRYRFEGVRGVWMTTFQALFRNRSAVIGIVMVGFFGFVANFAANISPHDPIKTLIGPPRTPPCIAWGQVDEAGNSVCTRGEYLMGLDPNGRDVFSRIVWGSRISIPIGVIAVSISIFFGVFLGLVSGYFGGWVDNSIMRIMDVLLAFPSLLLAIAIVTVLGPGLQNALIAISIVATPSYARLMRASVLSLKEQEFVLAERALGASDWRIMFNQILPNALTPIVVQGTLGVGTAVLEAAALSFLGLGAQPPAAEWGQMLSEAFRYFQSDPYLVFYPGICIMLIVLGFNLLGDGLRDALDPRLNKN